MKAKPFEQTHLTINCIDCGAGRVIKLQDKHQVVRCVECQKKYRTRRRNEIREVSSDALIEQDIKKED